MVCWTFCLETGTDTLICIRQDVQGAFRLPVIVELYFSSAGAAFCMREVLRALAFSFMYRIPEKPYISGDY